MILLLVHFFLPHLQHRIPAIIRANPPKNHKADVGRIIESTMITPRQMAIFPAGTIYLSINKPPFHSVFTVYEKAVIFVLFIQFGMLYPVFYFPFLNIFCLLIKPYIAFMAGLVYFTFLKSL